LHGGLNKTLDISRISTLIRSATTADSEAIARIYNHYISESVITFEEDDVSPKEMAGRVQETIGSTLPWLVAEDQGVVVGYAYASKWKARSAYRFAVESTVYPDHQYTGKGVGTKLYEELLGILRTKSLHVVIGGIAQPNPASVALHERLGFEKVAHFKEVGFKFGRRVDVGYWQLAL
jgi:phosphinothricin acetyltransferase